MSEHEDGLATKILCEEILKEDQRFSATRGLIHETEIFKGD